MLRQSITGIAVVPNGRCEMAGRRVLQRKGQQSPLGVRPAGGACVLLLLLLALLLPAAANATMLEQMSVEQLARHASLIVEGTVISTTVGQTADGEVRTAVRLDVRRALKGAPGDVVTCYVPGGTLPDGTEVTVAAMPVFAPGDECYVFVDVRGWVIAGFQGKLDVVDGRVAGSGATRAATNGRIEAALSPAGSQPDASGPRSVPATRSPRALGGPLIVSVTPGEASAGTNSTIVISGTGFGAREGLVEFTYGNDDVARIVADNVPSWSDTQIECAVPTGIIKRYAASAGSGPMWVTTAAGAESAPFEFSVPFSFGGDKWRSPRVTYYVNTSGVDSALRESLVDAGTAEWNAAGSGFTFVDGGRTTAGLADDGKNVISWSKALPSGVIAQSSSTSDNGVISEADIRYSNAYGWGDGAPGSGTMDIQSIATHEVGHWLVLDDLYGPGDTAKVMYGFGEEEWVVRTLAPGDAAGINWIYPEGGGSDDLIGPVCAAKNASVKRGKTVKIYFSVYDESSPQVTSQVAIKTLTGAVKKSWSWDYDENYDGWWTVKYKCTLPVGVYQIVVTGEDLAGNPASKVGRALLTVR
jgi:hypothetical protein